MKINLPNAISSRVAHKALVAQKHSPQILFYSGLVLMGASVVTACKGTLRLEDTLEDIARDREVVASADERRYSEKELRKLNAYVTIKGVVRIAKLYMPAITLGVAAVACLTSSHNQLTRRNAGLSAALAATERALDSYRNRVREDLGEDKELELWNGEKTTVVNKTDADGKKLKEKTVTRSGYSQYARVWGRDTTNEWDPQPEYNLAKLKSVQELCTLRLNSRGHLFLNEVFDELGLERMPYGAVVGWLSQKYGGADGFCDFGILSPGEEVRFLDFVTGRENHIMLDFNVDGEIWRKI